MKYLLKWICVAGVLLPLTACSFFSPVKVPPDTGYVIDTVPDHIKKSHRKHRTILVLHPDTNPIYNTSRIAFTMQPYQVSYYNYSHWVLPPADMLTPLIAKTIKNTHLYRTVAQPPFAGQYDFALHTNINKLEVDYSECVPVLRLQVDADLLRAIDGRVIASRSFNVVTPLHHKTPYSAVVAANESTSVFLAELARWMK